MYMQIYVIHALEVIMYFILHDRKIHVHIIYVYSYIITINAGVGFPDRPENQIMMCIFVFKKRVFKQKFMMLTFMKHLFD